MLWSGCPWRALRPKCASYQTVHRYFSIWSGAEIFKKAYEIAYKLQRRPVRRKQRLHCIDSSFVKNIYGRDCVGRNPTDRDMKASKLSAVIDEHGLPLSLIFFPANCHKVRTVDATLNAKINVENMGSRPPLYADKGYDSKAVRTMMQENGYIDRVGKRGKRVHRVVNRKRNIGERFFSWLDKSRRLILRYDTNITSYASWTWLACLRLLNAQI